MPICIIGNYIWKVNGQNFICEVISRTRCQHILIQTALEVILNNAFSTYSTKFSTISLKFVTCIINYAYSELKQEVHWNS